MTLDSAQPDRNALEAAQWSLKIRDGLTAEEEGAFDRWFATDGNAEAFERVVTTWSSLGEARGEPELLQLRSAALEDFTRANQRRWTSPFRIGARAAIAMAASLVLLLLGSYYFATLPDLYQTGVGERRVAVLDDGSRLSLDADTAVEVDYHGAHRELRLIRGRAKFDVAKDPLRPFSVLAGNRLVVATGTSFSVEVLTERMRVLLYEGRVEVLDDDEKAGATGGRRGGDRRNRSLAVPGTELEAAFTPGVRDVVTREANLAPTWEAGELAFADEPLSDVLLRFNRYSDVRLMARDTATMQVPISGVFRADDLAGFLESIREINGLKIEREGKIIYLSAPDK